jgi:protein disulfide-isomerase A1
VSRVSQLSTSLSKILSLIVSLIFNRKGTKTDYTGGRTENDIVNWILKKVGPASNEVTAEQLKTKVDENKLSVAYFGDVNAREFKEVFLEVANNPTVGDKFQFYHLNDEATAKSYGASSLPAIVLFRKFDDSPLVYSGNWETTPVVDFIVASSVPTLINFSEDYIEPIFGQRKAAVFLFRSNEDSEADFVNTFSDAATKLKGEILFVVSGIKDGIQTRLAEFVGVDSNSLPTVRILNPSDNMRKYTFPGDVKGLKFDELK